MFKVIDNVLSKSYLYELQNYFLSQECEWYFNDQLTGDMSYHKLGSYGFTMRLHWNQMFVDSHVGTLCRALILTAQDKVQEFTNLSYQIIRARADMTLYNPEKYRHEIHTDYPYEHFTGIFYLNSSDGNTLLYDRDGLELITEVEPIENRLVIFDGLMRHTGHSPAKNKSRVLINMNFMTSELIDELNVRYGRS